MSLKDKITEKVFLLGYVFEYLEALTASSSGDLLGSTSGYHSYEPSPFNHRLKQSSLLDPSAAEFHLEIEPSSVSNHQSTKRSSCHNDQQLRRASRSQNQTAATTQRIATSCK